MSNMNDLEINSINNKPINNDINEIKFIKRTTDNYTHEDLSDKKIKKITSWRKSQKKFFVVLILNILTLGMFHLISKRFPKLYLKLYCKKCLPKNSDFFLVENIYGQCKLCQTNKTKQKLSNDFMNSTNNESSKAYMCLFTSWNLNNVNINFTNENTQNSHYQYVNINNKQIISFIYNYKVYEYDEIKNAIFPVFLNLSGKTHKSIINIFQRGLSSEHLVQKIEERFGKNEFRLNINLVNIYFKEVEIKIIILSVIYGALEVAVKDLFSTGLLIVIVTLSLIFRKIVLFLLINKYNKQDFTIDGEISNQQKVKRNYLINKIKNHNIKEKQIDNDKNPQNCIKNKKRSKNRQLKHYNEEKQKKRSDDDNENYIDSDNHLDDKKTSNELIEDNNYQYVEINNGNILPGDIIYLKRGNYVPCDGIILEGDCVVNAVDVNENIEYSYKTFLKYTNDTFDYKNNKNNILLHGMKIVNVLKKNLQSNNYKNQFLTILCINTGANTYKANKITNILDLFERKEKYREMYKFITGQRLTFLICGSIIFFVSLFIPTILIIIKAKKKGIESLIKSGLIENLDNNQDRFNGKDSFYEEIKLQLEKMKSEVNNTEEGKKKIKMIIISNYLKNFLLRTIIKSYTPLYFIVSSFVILLGSYRLYNLNIFCFDKMRFLYANDIKTIFMSKINVLCDEHYKIKSFHPSFQNSKSSTISLQTYYQEELKDFSSIIFNYYNEIKSKKVNKESTVGLTNINTLNKISGKYSVWLLECLLCCNNLVKIGHVINGNPIEKILFTTMKWEIKFVNDDLEDENNRIKYFEELFVNPTEKSDKESFSDDDDDEESIKSQLYYFGSDKEEKVIDNHIIDIFPQNYYKMIDRKNFGYQKILTKFKLFVTKAILKRKSLERLSTEDFLQTNNNNSDSKANKIINDLSKTKCSSYKLRIYKKFLTKNSLFSSAIVYNFLLKTLRFMTKGSPEKILPHCLSSTLPEDICQIISSYRKDGYTIIVCAVKKIDVYSYNDENDERFYMKDLSFCGFITLKNNTKKDTKKNIEELKKMNCNLIMNTGDNLYSSVGTGFAAGILENKKIYALDLDIQRNEIYFNNIYRPKFYDYEIEEKINEMKKRLKSSNPFSKRNRKRNMTMAKSKKIDDFIIKLNPLNNDKQNMSNKKKRVNRNSQNTVATNSIMDDSLISSERKQVMSRNSTYNNTEQQTFKHTSDNNIQSNLNREINNSTINISINSHFLSTPKIVRKPLKKQQFALNYKLLSETKKTPNINNDFVQKRTIRSIEKKSLKNSDTFNTPCITNEYDNNEYEGEQYVNEYFSNIWYFSEYSLQKLEENSIFCVSGTALRYIYDNRHKNNYAKLLKMLSKKTKIFFSMTSEDKSFIIEYYRELSNQKICMVGYSISDIDSMMTAHVGISLKEPANINMILFHFYIASQNLGDIKTIIAHGKVIFENIFMLLISSILCIIIIDMYMAFCFYILMNVRPNHLRILNFIFFVLSIFGFTNSADRNINNSLTKNNQLHWKYVIIQLIGIVIIKVYAMILFFCLYRKNNNIDENKRDEIFTTYFSILSYNQIFSILFSFNYIRFYRKIVSENYLFFFLLLVFFSTILSITCLTRAGSYSLILEPFIFENSLKNSDTFDDRNKFIMFLIIVIDLCCTIVFVSISKYCYNKNSSKNKNEIKE